MWKHGLSALALLALLLSASVARSQTTTTAAPTTTTTAAPTTTTTAAPTTTTVTTTTVTTTTVTTTTTTVTTTTVTTTTVTTTTTSTTTTTTLPPATWNLVQNKDCTGIAAASGLTANVVNCCTAAKNGFCPRRENFGTLFEVFATFVASGLYVDGGNDISVPVLAQAGIGTTSTIVWASCNPVMSGAQAGGDVSLYRTNASGRPARVVIGGVSGGTDISGTVIECLIYWY